MTERPARARGVIGRDVSAPFLAATDEQVARLRSLIAELDLFGTGETPV